jgi:MFS-type transporter involved in bile tolerance (Atg22 family)
MMLAMLSMFFIPQDLLAQVQFKLPILGEIRTVGYVLMFAGASWAMININSLPMVVDLTDPIKIGTYTGLYYFFSTAAAIAGPNINGWIVDLAGGNYAYIMFVGPVFMALALISMLGVRGGEAKEDAAHDQTLAALNKK